MAYMPAGHGSGSVTTIDFDGNVNFGSATVHIPERWAVVFKCKHGSFVVEGSSAKQLFSELRTDACVDIEYAIIEEQYDEQWIPVDMDFLRATITPCLAEEEQQ